MIPSPLTCDGMPCHTGVLTPTMHISEVLLPEECGPFPVVLQQRGQQDHVLGYWKFEAPEQPTKPYEPRGFPQESE